MSTWNIICRTGSGDAYLPPLGQDEPRLVIPIDQPGAPGEVVSGLVSSIREMTGGVVPEPAADLIYLAATIYSADLRVARKYGDDRWTRDFALYLPVSDPASWESTLPVLLESLGFLTGDRWRVELRRRQPTNQESSTAPALPPTCVSLFSGGLDSFVGAIDRLETGGPVALVSHYGPGVTSRIQRAVFEKLRTAYGDRPAHLRFWVHPPLGDEREGEPSMRSRSLLFLALGTAVASSYGRAVPLSVPENGYMSLNIPLTGTRLSSLSTRTTHPHFVDLFRRVLSAVGLAVPIELPYHFQTKGEMLAAARNKSLLREAAQMTMSCAHPEAGRHAGATPSLHCGYCVPCLIRRAATHAADVPDSPYRVDVLTDPPSPEKKSGRDLRAFLMALERMRGATERNLRFHALDAGPLPPDDFARYADVYLRGLRELHGLLSPLEAVR
jgi:7-cyano-7-deazaguanine synthase in queuosine biosynthesis